MKYKVITKFRDLKDGDHIYSVGDTYPRLGLEADEERADELLSTDNKIGKALIEAVESPKNVKEGDKAPKENDNSEKTDEDDDPVLKEDKTKKGDKNEPNKGKKK